MSGLVRMRSPSGRTTPPPAGTAPSRRHREARRRGVGDHEGEVAGQLEGGPGEQPEQLLLEVGVEQPDGGLPVTHPHVVVRLLNSSDSTWKSPRPPMPNRANTPSPSTRMRGMTYGAGSRTSAARHDRRTQRVWWFPCRRWRSPCPPTTTRTPRRSRRRGPRPTSARPGPACPRRPSGRGRPAAAGRTGTATHPTPRAGRRWAPARGPGISAGSWPRPGLAAVRVGQATRRPDDQHAEDDAGPPIIRAAPWPWPRRAARGSR